MSHNACEIAVLGAGSWGSTLARLWALAEKPVRLWTHDPQKVSQVKDSGARLSALKVEMPKSVFVSADLEAVVSDAEIVVFACTSQVMRSVARQIALVFQGTTPPILVSAAKGLELESLCRMSEVISQELPQATVAALSGPNLAAEILQGLPAASVIGCAAPDAGELGQHQLRAPTFRLYSNCDIVGVELGGTLKNIIAIAAGCSDGLSLGANAKAALITRGLAEMTRLAEALGAKRQTLAGLAGIGDLIATCFGPLSRNWRLGNLMAFGRSKEEALVDIGAAVEGISTTHAVCALGKHLKIELPIADQVEAMLCGRTTPREAIMALMSRPLVSE